VNAKDRLIVALDVKTVEEARALVDRLSGQAGMFKIGSQLFTAAGPALVREIVGRGEKVFLDLKYHDIPHTVANAVAEASRLGVSLMTLHALGGKAMMEAAVGALPAVGARLLAVTILTSHDEDSLAAIGLEGPVADSVQRLARLAQQSGVDGIVASPLEAEMIRGACGPDFLIVTPGIRRGGAKADDQARAAKPSAAIRAGASYVVVGRPIVEAADPVAAAAAVVRDMESVR